MAIYNTTSTGEEIASACNTRGYTMCGWFMLVTDPSAWAGLLDHSNSQSDYVYIECNGYSANMQIWVQVSGSGEGVDMALFSTNTWYFVALTISSVGDVKAWWNTIGSITLNTVTHTRASDSLTASAIRFGGTSWGEHFDGRMAYGKVWTAELTQDELLAEMYSVRPQRLNNLYGYYPMLNGSAERIRDYSGLAHNLTEVGTPTDTYPPPIAWGAPALTLPYAAAAQARLSRLALLGAG